MLYLFFSLLPELLPQLGTQSYVFELLLAWASVTKAEVFVLPAEEPPSNFRSRLLRQSACRRGDRSHPKQFGVRRPSQTLPLLCRKVHLRGHLLSGTRFQMAFALVYLPSFFLPASNPATF